MDAFTHRFFSRILYVSLIAGAVLLGFNEGHRIPAFALYALFTTLILFHHRRYYTPEAKDPAGRYFLAAELLLALVIQYFDHTDFIELNLFIVLADAILAYGKRFWIPFSIIGMTAYTAMLFYKSGNADPLAFWREVDASLVACAIYIAVMIIARYNILTGQKNRRLAGELEQKTKQLEQANLRLKAYSDELEKTADLRARERLTSELHDRLGHLLTTASVGVEAANVQLASDPAAAKERLKTARSQIQLAMQALRDVIRGGEGAARQRTPNFPEALEQLARETERQAGVQIEYGVSEEAVCALKTLEANRQSFLYHALMEGLTNGIRHGGATKFGF
jgi:signal transduction histidine kinase